MISQKDKSFIITVLSVILVVFAVVFLGIAVKYTNNSERKEEVIMSRIRFKIFEKDLDSVNMESRMNRFMEQTKNIHFVDLKEFGDKLFILYSKEKMKND